MAYLPPPSQFSVEDDIYGIRGICTKGGGLLSFRRSHTLRIEHTFMVLCRWVHHCHLKKQSISCWIIKRKIQPILEAFKIGHMVMGSCNTLSMTLACKRHVIPDVCTCNQPLRISTFGYHPCLSFTRISINQVWSSPLLPLQLTSRLVLFHNLSSCSDLEFRILSLCPHAWLYFCCRFPHLSLLTILTPPHFQLERLTSI